MWCTYKTGSMRLGSSKFYLNTADSPSRWLHSTGNVKRINRLAVDQRGRYVTCWCLQVASWWNYSPPNYHPHLSASSKKLLPSSSCLNYFWKEEGFINLSGCTSWNFYFVFRQLKHKSNQTRYGRRKHSHLMFPSIGLFSLWGKSHT
jgi:hypothetical protein